jgi:AraC-like DNA-binding protein
LPFRFELIAPTPDVAARINTFYIIETDAERIDEILPAYSAQLLVVIRGTIVLTRPDGTTGRSSTITINAPQLKSAPCVLEGPLTLIGASLNALGWQALSNLPADEVHDQMVPAEALLSVDDIARLVAAATACRTGEASPRDLCEALGAVVACGPFAPRPEHVTVVEAITHWLGTGFDPPLSDLHDRVDVSPRQLQRLSRRYFGVPPAQVLKRSRAIRAAMLLANPAMPGHLRDEMLASYFDQAHLIRDIRRYTGRTPTQLRAHSLSSGMLDPTGHGDSAALLRGGAA